MSEQTDVTTRFGWVPDLPDFRDHIYQLDTVDPTLLPKSVDLRADMPVVYDQGHLGSCTAQAIAAALEFNQRKGKLTDTFTPSRLFIYYYERLVEGTVSVDNGAMIRDGIKVVASQGAPHERFWPYVVAKFATTPTLRSRTDGRRHVALTYERLTPDLLHFKSCLASGYPFVFGFSVYEGFMSQPVALTGTGSLPLASERLLGGHAVLAVGYDDSTQTFLIRNSWSAAWGQQGYFTLPYAYLTTPNLSDDFWTIKSVK